MILYCVRHGQSTHNAEGRVQGQSDVPLSDFGRRQSEAVAQALAGLPIETIYTSPLRRALETARVVADATGLEIQTDPRLKEINAGIFQDRLRADLERLYPAEFARWLSGDPDFTIPGGESRRALARRGCEALEATRMAGPEHAAVVSHVRLLVVTLEALALLPEGQPLESLHNGSITRLRLDPDGRAHLLSLNQTDHLDDLDTDGPSDL